jgi:hypothetical protein
MRQRSDGSAAPEILIPGGEEKYVLGFTPDGSSLIYRQFGRGRGFWLLPLPKGASRLLLPGLLRTAALSPDGKWLAYDSAESGRYEVYARRFPEMDLPVQVSVDGGSLPQWSPDGRAIYFVTEGDHIFRARVEPGESLGVARPEAMFDAPNMRSYGIDPAGSGFFATIRAPESGKVRQLHLVTNWFTELERLAPRGKGR